MATSKGRFAVVVVSAMVLVPLATIASISQTRVVETGLAILDAVIGTKLVQQVPQDSPIQILEYFILVSICTITTYFLGRFGTDTVRSWNGPTTTADAPAIERGEDKALLPVALSYLRFKLSGDIELPIDPKTIGGRQRLPAPPAEPHV